MREGGKEEEGGREGTGSESDMGKGAIWGWGEGLGSAWLAHPAFWQSIVCLESPVVRPCEDLASKASSAQCFR